jgi:hypothetical protein
MDLKIRAYGKSLANDPSLVIFKRTRAKRSGSLPLRSHINLLRPIMPQPTLTHWQVGMPLLTQAVRCLLYARTIVFVAASLSTFPPIPAFALENSSVTETYRLSKTAIRCVIQSKDTIRAITRELIVLNISVCPPIGVDVINLIPVRNSALPTKSMQVTDSPNSPDTILIIPKDHLDCFISKVESLSPIESDPVSVDFSSCLQ